MDGISDCTKMVTTVDERWEFKVAHAPFASATDACRNESDPQQMTQASLQAPWVEPLACAALRRASGCHSGEESLVRVDIREKGDASVERSVCSSHSTGGQSDFL